jgi:hypothetical protein
MGGWLAQCAHLLQPLYAASKKVLFQSKVIGTDDTSVKVLDVKLPFARTGRLWPYYGDKAHPVILYEYTATRERAGPESFWKGFVVIYRPTPTTAMTRFSRTRRGAGSKWGVGPIISTPVLSRAVAETYVTRPVDGGRAHGSSR